MNEPLSADEVKALIERLWAPLEDGTKPNVFMVLDCARDKRIEPLIKNSNLEQRCLYTGQLAYTLKRVAPHIVNLSPDSEFTREIFRLGWGKSWGVCWLTHPKTSMTTLRANCRHLGKVKGVNGENLVFRYYDPRVLRLMLPVCNHYEVDCILGEASSLVIEQENGLGFTLFERGDANTPMKVRNVGLNENKQSLITGPRKDPSHAWRNLLQIRQEHMDAMQKKLDDKEFLQIKADYIQFYIKDAENLSEHAELTSDEYAQLSFVVEGKYVDLDGFLRLCFNKAKEFKLDSSVSILTFIYMNQQYGWQFWTKQEYKWVEDILQSGRPAEARIDAISDKFSRMLMERMWS